MNWSCDLDCCRPLKDLSMDLFRSLMPEVQLSIRWLVSWWQPVKFVPQQGADELLNLCKGIIGKAVQHLGTKRDGGRYLMNSHQCDFLVRRLLETQDTLADYQQLLLDLDGKAIPVLEELHQALLNAERLIHSSCITSSKWLRAAIEQGDIKESFSKVLYEVQWHKFVLQCILVQNFRVSGIRFQLALSHGELTERDRLGLGSAMKEDEWVLKARLRSVIHLLDDPIEELLANELLKKMEAVEDQLLPVSFESSHQLLKERETKEQSTMVGKDLNDVVSVTASSLSLLFLNPQNLNDYYCGTLLGRGSFAEVRETTLLGCKYAIKIFEQHHTYSFDQEVAALQGLGHHPHIVRLLCYSKNNSKCFLIMEKMDMDLSQFLQLRKDTGAKLSDLEAVGLMLQIAEGVRYIHSKHMAHRDLKLGNVLVNVEDPSRKFPSRARSVKITDFGLTKTKNASIAKADHTVNTGTLRYMAPEVINAPGIIEGDSDKTELIPKKADVYSFGIMCSEILTGENAFGNLLNNEVKKHVKAGGGPMSRPNLPMECPERLASLIRRCWVEDLYKRLDFDVICEELRNIKVLLLRGNQLESQTEDVIVEFGSLRVQRTQDFKIPSSQASSKRRVSSLLFEQAIRLSDVRRVNWASQIWNCPVVLVFSLLLLLSLGVTSYHSKQHQVPSELSSGVKTSGQFYDVAAPMKGISVVAAPMKGDVIRQGPWGRKDPNKIRGFFDHKADSIKSIKLKYDQNPPRVGLMEVDYVNSNGGEFKKGYCWDTIGSKMVKMDFEPNEYIKRVSGSVALYFVEVGKRKVPLYSVVSLTFHTNLRSYGPYGDEVGDRIAFTSGTGKVIGFFGAAGVLLDKLGVWIIPDGEFEGDQSVLIQQ